MYHGKLLAQVGMSCNSVTYSSEIIRPQASCLCSQRLCTIRGRDNRAEVVLYFKDVY